ncbi:hybrid sensor histidine kinase/response regulator [Haloferula sargassicola]|uniref:hybrid sensor histidine kinase/response regulator n=1 Tax=Haloferula sargassicola TaxID=490096 RepID=UPI0033654757
MCGIGPLSLWHVLAISLVFISVAILYSRKIMRAETQAATLRLQSFTAGAARHLESQFDGLRDDFRLLASLDAFHSYLDAGPLTEQDRRNQAMVRRFFARHQESIEGVRVDLRTGRTFEIRILPGNYLDVSAQRPTAGGAEGPTSSVTHEGERLVVSERLPAGLHSAVVAVHLVVPHADFLRAGLESYMMGQSELWIWSVEDDARPSLIRHPLSPGGTHFEVPPEVLEFCRQLLAEGLEGIREHEVAFPDKRPVVSVFNPLRLAGEPLGLVFSSEKDRHLASLHRLSGFLLIVFSGGLVLMGAWFGFSYLQIRRSEAAAVAARKDAETAARAKSDFVAAMSHEVRTPLHGILGYAELLRQSGLTGEQQRHIGIVRKCGDHLLTLLNDILDFSRLEAGALVLRDDEFSAADLVREVVELLSTAAQAKGLTLDGHVGSGLPLRVRGDAGRVRQVLFNLVGNAIKFTPSGGVAVRVSPAAGGRVRFEVADTGIGIAAGQDELLFQPFSQIDRSSSRSFEGTGLGLAICRRLIRQMGGEIGFESAPDLGSTFFFEIRLPEVATSLDRVLDGRRLLWVGTPPAEGFAGQVAMLGASLECLAEPLAALHRMRTQPPDLLLIHGTEPGGDCARLASAQAGTVGIPCARVMDGADDVCRAGSACCVGIVLPTELRPLGEKLVSLMKPPPPPPPRARPEGAVLIVDDSEVNRSLLAALLRRHGLAVTEAGGGRDALEVLTRRAFQLIFMDVEMPGMDGLETTRRVREMEASAGMAPMAIVGLSAHAFHEDRELALAAGMNDYLTKPLTLEALDRVLVHYAGPTAA